ncbi:uncharacterized protein LOC123504770 isoform X4 [Portunus trituberculatus]|uniref:uncharacterized protein LOC123504770 isoform X4 n=2 Tax=Portunus trituberculatus TaxID=210409 RepID=UPI001E1CF8BB|nr:uncharacterized protein LOC123504770 isoform X4 [Portunus trituberculatus]
MAVKHYLAWTVMLAALPGATTLCNSCIVDVGADASLGFLDPTMCCDEVDYPFTFLAHFSAYQHSITFHLHEYYLLDTQIRVCQSVFYDLFYNYDYVADDYNIETYCLEDYPIRCLPDQLPNPPELSFRTWSEDGVLNITVPNKPRPVLQTHGQDYTLSSASVWVTPMDTTVSGEENAMHTIATLSAVHMGNAGTTEAASSVCVTRITLATGVSITSPVASLSSHQLVGKWDWNAATCVLWSRSHIAYVLPTWCCTTPHIASLELVDVTVQLLDSHPHLPLDQVTELLREACITVVNASYENSSSKEFHFAMNKYQRNCLPEKSQWEAVLESSVNLNLPKQDFLWVGPLNKSVEEGNLVLKCTVYTSLLPVRVSFFTGHHQIFSREVESCYGHYHDEVITFWLEKDEDSINTTCSFNNICTNNTICTITLMAEGYDPDLDWEKFSVEVSQGNTTTQQSVVVEVDPQLVVVVQPPSAAVKKSGNTTLICTLIGDWKWNEDCEISWVFPVDSGVFEVETPAWNVSYLYIKDLERSITVSCEVAIWRFCDDRMNRSTSVCVGRGCKPEVVTIHCLEPETLFCPEQKDASQTWHITPVNAMSYSNCPEGFDGISKRVCELGQNDAAIWAEPDYYHCVYQPFSTLLKRPVMRYLKRGFHVAVDCNSTVMEIKQLFEARRSMLLPREHVFIQDQMKYLLKPGVTPVDIEVFLRFFQEIRKKMASNDAWQLIPLARTYLNLVTGQRGACVLDDLVLLVQDIPAEWEYSNEEHSKRLHLEMAVQAKEGKALHAGALVFLDPRSIPAGVVYDTESKQQVHGHKLTGPVVEIVVSTNNDMSLVAENITVNMSYYDLDVTTERNVCGGAKVSGTLAETLKWDLTRCTVLNPGHRSRRITRCHCQGPGVFAFIKMPEIQTDDSALKRPVVVVVVVVVTCCAFILLLLLVLLRVFLLSSASSLSSGRRRQNNGGSSLMNELKARMTSSMLCFSSDTNAQSDIEMDSMSSTSEAPHSSPGSTSVRSRRNNKDFYPDPHYLNMESATDFKRFVHSHIYENVFDHSEPKQQARQNSHVSDCEYMIPDDIHFPLFDDHESDPDDSQC